MTYGLRALAVLAIGVSGAAIAAEARAEESYQADPVHSSVVFRVKHMNTTYFWGRFNEITGTFSLDSADPAQNKFQFQVKAGSVNTGEAKRDEHLKGPDFFNAVEFPTISFVSTGATKLENGYEVSGDLTLHGVTKPIKVRVVPTGTGKGPTGAPIAGIESTFTISQKDFGITKMANMIGDDVLITVGVEGIKK